MANVKHTSAAHITPVRDGNCGKMCLLIGSEAEGEGTAGGPANGSK